MNFSNFYSTILGALIVLGLPTVANADYVASTMCNSCTKKETQEEKKEEIVEQHEAKKDKHKDVVIPVLTLTFSFDNLMTGDGSWRGIVNSPDGKGYITPVMSVDNAAEDIVIEAKHGNYLIEFLVLDPEGHATNIGSCSVKENFKNSPPTVFIPEERTYRAAEEDQFTLPWPPKRNRQ